MNSFSSGSPANASASFPSLTLNAGKKCEKKQLTEGKLRRGFSSGAPVQSVSGVDALELSTHGMSSKLPPLDWDVSEQQHPIVEFSSSRPSLPLRGPRVGVKKKNINPAKDKLFAMDSSAVAIGCCRPDILARKRREFNRSCSCPFGNGGGDISLRLRPCEDGRLQPPEQLFPDGTPSAPPIYAPSAVAMFRRHRRSFVGQTLSTGKARLKPAGASAKVPALDGNQQPSSAETVLLRLHRRRHELARQERRKRCEQFARVVLTQCRRLRSCHNPSPPDISASLAPYLPAPLLERRGAALVGLLAELATASVGTVELPELGKARSPDPPFLPRLRSLAGERSALSRAMDNFPPGVRGALAEALRPLDAVTLVAPQESGGTDQGTVELAPLMAEWRAAAQLRGRQLREKWWPEAVDAIRGAALLSGLSMGRRHALMHAFNNLLASKLQQVLGRSVEAVLRWLGAVGEDEWLGPRVVVRLELEDGVVTLQPDAEHFFSRLRCFYEELRECVQLYRATWEEPKPPPVPKWRLLLAERFGAVRVKSSLEEGAASSPENTAILKSGADTNNLTSRNMDVVRSGVFQEKELDQRKDGGQMNEQEFITTTEIDHMSQTGSATVDTTVPWDHLPPPNLQPRREVLVVSVGEVQWEGFLQDTSDILARTHEKASVYVQQIQQDWSTVLCGHVSAELDTFLKSDSDLASYARQVVALNTHVQRASHVPLAVMVDVFRLDYGPLRRGLLSLTNSYVEELRGRLVKEQQADTLSLQQQYQSLCKALQQSPDDSAQLFKVMEAVEEARRLTLGALHERVEAMAARLKVLLDVVHLPRHDMLAAAEVIGWPARAQPLLERAIESLEEFKQQFEERLGREQAELGRGLERGLQLLGELEELNDAAHVAKYIKEVYKIEARLQKVGELVVWVHREEALFKFPRSSYPLLEELTCSLVPYSELFSLVLRWRGHEKHWMDGDFRALDPHYIDSETELITRDLEKLKRSFKSKFKQQALEGDPKKARINFDDPNPKNLPGPLCICGVTLQQVQLFRQHLPLVSVLCNKALRPRHWTRLNDIAQRDITPNAGTSLRKVVSAELGPTLHRLQVVSVAASREQRLEQQLEDMKAAWRALKILPRTNREWHGQALGVLDEAEAVVKEQLVTVHVLQNSPFVGPFAEEVHEWQLILLQVRETLDYWMQLQGAYLQLLPLFSRQEFQAQKPQHSTAFKTLEEVWLSVVNGAAKETEALKWLLQGRQSMEAVHEVLLEVTFLTVGRDEFLMEKRKFNPRLFYLSDNELQELICASDWNDFFSVLTKCFPAIYEVLLEPQPNVIKDLNTAFAVGVRDVEGEELLFFEPLQWDHRQLSVESWLTEVVKLAKVCDVKRTALMFQQKISQSLQQQMNLVITSKEVHSTGSFLVGSPMSSAMLPDGSLPTLQVEWAAHRAYWSAKVERGMRGGKNALLQRLTEVSHNVNQLCKSFAAPVVASCINDVQFAFGQTTETFNSVMEDDPSVEPSGNLGAAQRVANRRHNRAETLILRLLRRQCLLMETMSQRDVLTVLCALPDPSEESYEWQTQLRFYWKRDDHSMGGRVLDHCIPYGWEYNGSHNASHYSTPTSAFVKESSTSSSTAASELPSHTSSANVTLHAFALARAAILVPALLTKPTAGNVETIKGVCCSLALLHRVVPCHPHLSANSVRRMVQGAAAGGAVLVLQEVQVLNALAMSRLTLDLEALNRAKRTGKDEFQLAFRECPLRLHPNAIVAVTLPLIQFNCGMLPSNLQSILKMSVLETISPVGVQSRGALGVHSHVLAEVRLRAAGFQTAPDLARNLVAVFEALENCTPRRSQYCFGHRSLLQVLRVCENSLLLLLSDKTEESGNCITGSIALNSQIDQETASGGNYEYTKPGNEGSNNLIEYELNKSKIFYRKRHLSNEKKFLEDELFIVNKALLDHLLPTMHTEDMPLLWKVMSELALVEERQEDSKDLYLSKSTGETEAFLTALAAECLERRLQLSSLLQTKALQVHRALQCSSVVLLGAPQTGKTELLKVVCGAVGRMQKGSTCPVISRVYPMTSSPEQLWGSEEGIKREGRLSALLQSPSTWLVLDGPVTNRWVVMLRAASMVDGTLLLTSGRTFKPNPSAKIIFETTDLEQVTSDFVSLCRVIFVPEGMISWRSIMHSHLHQCASGSSSPTRLSLERAQTSSSQPSSSIKSHLRYSRSARSPSPGVASVTATATSDPMPCSEPSVDPSATKLRAPASVLDNCSTSVASPGFQRSFSSSTSGHGSWWADHWRLVKVMAEWLVPPVLDFLKTECCTNGPTSDVALTKPLFSLATLLVEAAHEDAANAKERVKMTPQWTMAAFIHSLAVCLAGALRLTHCDLFGNFMRRLVYGELAGSPVPASLTNMGIPYPADGSILDVMFDSKQRSLWRPWTDICKNATLKDDLRAAELLVTTPETVRVQRLVSALLSAGRPVLVVGSTSSSWKEVCRDILSSRHSGQRNVLLLPITTQIAPQRIRDQVCYTLSTNSTHNVTNSAHDTIIRATKKSSDSKRLLVYADEVQLSQQPVQELLREAVQERCWGASATALDTVEWLCGMTARQGAPAKHLTNLLDERLLAQFSVVTAYERSGDSRQRVYTAQLTSFLRAGGFVPDMFSAVGGIASATLAINEHYRNLVARNTTDGEDYASLASFATVTRVLQGIALVEKKEMENKKQFIRESLNRSVTQAKCGLINERLFQYDIEKTRRGLWLHEMCREFGDGLQLPQQQSVLHSRLLDVTRTHFKDEIAGVMEKYAQEDGSVDAECIARLVWSHLCSAQGSKSATSAEDKNKQRSKGNVVSTNKSEGTHTLNEKPKPYEEVTDSSEIMTLLQQRLDEYNAVADDPIRLVMSHSIITHVSRLVRTLRRPGGHALLLGAVACGRRPCARLSAWLSGLTFRSVGSGGGDLYSLVRSMRAAILSSCIKGEGSVLYVGSKALESSGAVLHLLQELVCKGPPHGVLREKDVRNLLQHWRLSEGDPPVSDPLLWPSVQIRVRDTVHIVIAAPAAASLSAAVKDSAIPVVGGDLGFTVAPERVLQNYPSLYQSLTRDVYGEWDEEELLAVGMHESQSWPHLNNERRRMIQAAIELHLQARSLDCTEDARSKGFTVAARSFLRLLREYHTLHAVLTHRHQKELQLFTRGLSTIRFAETQMEELQSKLGELHNSISEAQEDTRRRGEVAAKIGASVAILRSSVTAEEEDAAEVERAAESLRAECEGAIDVALPALLESIERLGAMKAADVSSLGSIKVPPSSLKALMGGVCVLLDVRPLRTKAGGKSDAWASGKRLLQEPRFLSNLQDLNPDSVPDAAIDKVVSEFLGPDLEPSVVGRISPAAEQLCRWLRALVQYRQLTKEYAPKREELVTLQQQAHEVLAAAGVRRNELSKREHELDQLKSEHVASVQLLDELKAQLDNCAILLERAKKLHGVLLPMENAWTVHGAIASEALQHTHAVALLCSASITYLSAMSGETRDTVLKQWSSTLACRGLTLGRSLVGLTREMVTSDIVEAWHLRGLPRDEVAIEAAVCITQSLRVPVVLDPEGLGWRWLQQLHAGNVEVLEGADIAAEDWDSMVGRGSRVKKKNIFYGLNCDENNLDASSTSSDSESENTQKGIKNESIKGQSHGGKTRRGARDVIENCITSGIKLLVRIQLADWASINALQSIILHFSKMPEKSDNSDVKFGKKHLLLHPEFRLFIVIPAIETSPPAKLVSSLNLILFDVSNVGVESYLRQVLIWHESADMYESLQRPWIRQLGLQSAVSVQEERLLEVLLQEGDDILKDQEQFDTVHHAMAERDILQARLHVCLQDKASFTQQQELYKIITRPAAVVYVVIAALPAVCVAAQVPGAGNVKVDNLTEFSARVLCVAKESPLDRCLQRRLSGVLRRLLHTLAHQCCRSLPLQASAPLAATLALLYLRWCGQLNMMEVQLLHQTLSTTDYTDVDSLTESKQCFDSDKTLELVSPEIKQNSECKNNSRIVLEKSSDINSSPKASGIFGVSGNPEAEKSYKVGFRSEEELNIESIKEAKNTAEEGHNFTEENTENSKVSFGVSPYLLHPMLRKAWTKCCLLSRHPTFERLLWSLANEAEQWNSAVLEEGTSHIEQRDLNDSTSAMRHSTSVEPPCYLQMSLLPVPWCQLAPVDSLMLLLAVNREQCSPMLFPLVQHTFTDASLPTAFSPDSYTTVLAARDHFRLPPSPLSPAMRLELPRPPLLVLLGASGDAPPVMGDCVEEILVEFEEEEIMIVSFDADQDYTTLSSAVFDCCNTGRVLVLKHVHLCRLVLQQRLAALLHAAYRSLEEDDCRSGGVHRTAGRGEDPRLRFRVLITADARVEISPPLLLACSPLWLQDHPSLQGALTSTLAIAVKATSTWNCTSKVPSAGGVPLCSLLLSVSLLHALLWLWGAGGHSNRLVVLGLHSWKGVKPNFAVSDLYIVLNYLKPFFVTQQPLQPKCLSQLLSTDVYGTKLSNTDDFAVLRSLVDTLLDMAGLTVNGTVRSIKKESSAGMHVSEDVTPRHFKLSSIKESKKLPVEHHVQMTKTEQATICRSGLPSLKHTAIGTHADRAEVILSSLRNEIQPLFDKLPCRVEDLSRIVWKKHYSFSPATALRGTAVVEKQTAHIFRTLLHTAMTHSCQDQ